MSWNNNNNNSQYDENPFSENPTNNSSEHIRAPLTQNAAKLENPPWLQESPSGQQTNPNSVAGGGDGGATAEVDPSVPRMILYTRVINLILSVLMILVSLLSLLTTQSATTGVLACYLVVFSCLLCCFETHLKQVSKIIALNFGFMYSAKSRSVFMMFVGTILFSLSLFGKIVGCAMLMNSAFNIFILAKYPGYEDIQRNDAQSEIKDFLAANPAFAEKIMSVGAKAGADIIQNNPDLAKQAGAAVFSAATQPAQPPSGYTSV